MYLSKKAKRHESKLKKAKAFLELAGYTPKSHQPHPTHSSASLGHLLQSQSHSQAQTSDHNIVIRHKGEVNMSSNESTGQRNMDMESTAQTAKAEMPREEAFQEMKRIMREKNKRAMQKPKVFLTLENLAPHRLSNSDSFKDDILPPLYLLDLQHLLLYALQGNIASFKPRWCKLLRVMKVSSVVFLCLDGVGYDEVINDADNFSWISQTFHTHVEMVCPEQYRSSAIEEVSSVPLSVSQLKKVNQKVPAKVKSQIAAKLNQHKTEEKVSRLCLLLSSHQMKMEGYPMPIMTRKGQYEDFVFSKDHYTQVTSSSPLFSLDCEMCLTTLGRNELTRVSVISENGEVVYDSLVKPRNRIINYLTKFSGITKDMMEPVVTVLEDVQQDIRDLLPADAILCGQSLNSDLISLKMFHPYVIDTSVIYNMSGNRSIKAGLRKLSSFFLSRNIQNSPTGHCSAEDAKAALDLVKLKLNKGLEFGDATIGGIYFPSIETYFLGESNGTTEAAQNLEIESSEDKVVKSMVPLPQTASDFLRQQSKGNLKQGMKRTLDTSSTGSSASDSDEKSGYPTNEKASKKCKISQDDSSDFNCSDVKACPSDSTQVSKSTDITWDGTQSSKVPWAGTQEQTTIFSQTNSVHVSHSFFKLINDAGRSGCFIGPPSLTSKYREEPIEMITTSNDSEARKCAKSMVQSKEFVWAYFSEYREALSSGQCADTVKQKRKLDQRARSVFKKVKENALVVLLSTGRQQGDKNNSAGVFVKIT